MCLIDADLDVALQRFYFVSEDAPVSKNPPTDSAGVPWRQRPRRSLRYVSPHLVLAPALLALIGIVLTVDGFAGSMAWPRRVLTLIGGLLLTAVTVAYWVMAWLYVERPHEKTLDR